MFRSKVIWLEQGEKPTKYFFNLEKTNYEKKLIREVKLENGEVTLDSTRIEKELEKYFTNMYASKAPFTWVRTNFCTDEFCTWAACLHGTVQILLQIAVVFTWVCANFETSCVFAMIG